MELEYKQPMEVYAVVFGYLIRTFGKIQSSKVNKIVEPLEYDKINVATMKDYSEKIENDPHLLEILEKAIDGDITPDQLKKYNTDIEPIESEEELHGVLTPYMAQHQRVLKNNRYFNKIQREGAYLQILFEDMKEDLRKDLSKLEVEKEPFEFTYTPTDNTLMVILGDWHIGATIVDHTYHGGYNYGILNRRLDYLLEEVKKKVALYKPNKIVCLYVGDLIEGADMRGGQKWQLEFDLSEQVSKGQRALMRFLGKLENIAPVIFGANRGNHDRLTGQANKKDNIYNDSSLYVILDMMFMMQEEFGALQNTHLIDNRHDMYDVQVEVNHRLIVGSHGDALKGNGSHFSKFVEDRAVSMLVTGHVHTFKVNQDNRDHLHITNGSIMGYNDYAKELKLTKTAPEQTIVILPKEESPIILPVFMEHIK